MVSWSNKRYRSMGGGRLEKNVCDTTTSRPLCGNDSRLPTWHFCSLAGGYLKTLLLFVRDNFALNYCLRFSQNKANSINLFDRLGSDFWSFMAFWSMCFRTWKRFFLCCLKCCLKAFNPRAFVFFDVHKRLRRSTITYWRRHGAGEKGNKK